MEEQVFSSIAVSCTGASFGLPHALLLLVIVYVVSSTPYGLIFSKLAGYGDIRQIGSGNIGATNVLRTGNKFLAALTLVCDALKGAIFILPLQYLDYLNDNYLRGPDKCPYMTLASVENVFGQLATPFLFIGLAAILGHCFPIWLKFKGGKGVSTAIGTLLAALPLTGLAAFAIWLGMAFAFRISSLAALTATAATPIITLALYGPFPALVTVLIAALIIWRHKDNIRRLLKGEEPKIGKKK